MFRRLIKNVRLGLATNSSSSHSLVYMKRPVSDDSVESGAFYENEYGWEQFRLDTLGSKLFYGVCQAVNGLGGWYSDLDPAEVHARYEQYGHLFPEFTEADFAYAARGYVDHQSQWDGSLDELVTELRKPEVVVYGGNDNDGNDATYEVVARGEAEKAVWLHYGGEITKDKIKDDGYGYYSSDW